MVQYSTKTGRPLAPCKAGYVRNPLTNRCVLRKKKGSPPCKKGQVRNPFTNRCRKELDYKNFPWKKKAAKKASPKKPGAAKAKRDLARANKELERARKKAYEVLRNA